MITLRGIGVVIVGVVLFVLAGVSRVGWLFMFDAVLWGTIAVSAVMPWLAIGRLQAHRTLAGWARRDEIPGPMEGEPVEFEVRLTNRGLLPCMFVAARYNCVGKPAEGQKRRLFITWLRRNASATARTSVIFERRGRYTLPPLRVETNVPFGLFRKSKLVSDPLEVVILPKVYPLEGLELLGNDGVTDPLPLQARVGEQVIGSRSYAPGDPWQRIHWRNTARKAQPQVKEYERSPDNSIVVALGITRRQESPLLPLYQRGSKGDFEALEDAVKVAASVGDFVCRMGGAVRLVTGDESGDTSSRLSLLTALALFEGAKGDILPALSGVLPPFSDVLAIVLDTDGHGIEALAQLARSQNRLTVVVMRGFNPGNLPSNPAEALSESGAVVVECWPGDISPALNAWKRAGARPPHPAAASTRRGDR